MPRTLRSSAVLVLIGVLALSGLTGCGGSSIPEGIPAGTDFSKDYSPAAKPFDFSPKDAAKASAATKKDG